MASSSPAPETGQGDAIADLDSALIDARKRLMDARGHYSRPELLSLLIDWTPAPLPLIRYNQGIVVGIDDDDSQ